MQRRSARERLAEGAPPAFVLDKDMGAPLMTDAARFAATDSEGRPVVPLTAAQKYHFDTKGWLAIPGVLDDAEIAEMREFVLRLAAEPESIPEHRRSSVGGPLQRLTDHPVVIGFAQEFIYNPFTDGGGESLENEAGYWKTRRATAFARSTASLRCAAPPAAAAAPRATAHSGRTTATA